MARQRSIGSAAGGIVEVFEADDMAKGRAEGRAIVGADDETLVAGGAGAPRHVEELLAAVVARPGRRGESGMDWSTKDADQVEVVGRCSTTTA